MRNENVSIPKTLGIGQEMLTTAHKRRSKAYHQRRRCGQGRWSSVQFDRRD